MMTALVESRRASRPRIMIPTKQEVEDITHEYGLPSQLSTGSLTPELQPNTPPVLPNNGKDSEVLQIGKYLLVELLDSNIYRAVDSHTGVEKICKVFKHDTYRSKVSAYCRVHDNANVVEIKEIIMGDKLVYVFFDKHYGDLHSYVRSEKKLGENKAKELFEQIAQSVMQCHEAGIVIRDLKLRKFVFTNEQRTRIQLEGLEDSYIMENGDDILHDKQGCPAYVSPEILCNAQAGYSGRASDQWSCGVMLFTMLVGRYPFHESEPTKLFEKIRIGKFSIPSNINPKARCLIKNLLRQNANERLDAHDVLQHPWLKESKSPRLATSCRNSLKDQLVPTL